MPDYNYGFEPFDDSSSGVNPDQPTPELPARPSETGIDPSTLKGQFGLNTQPGLGPVIPPLQVGLLDAETERYGDRPGTKRPPLYRPLD